MHFIQQFTTFFPGKDPPLVEGLVEPSDNLFFLAMRLPKENFIGTTAWLFLMINIFKVPFHIFSWGTISKHTLTIDLFLAPAVLLGLFIGIRFVKRINEKVFRRFILIVTALGAILIYFKYYHHFLFNVKMVAGNLYDIYVLHQQLWQNKRILDPYILNENFYYFWIALEIPF